MFNKHCLNKYVFYKLLLISKKEILFEMLLKLGILFLPRMRKIEDYHCHFNYNKILDKLQNHNIS